MEPQLSTGNDYNDLQIDLLRNIMLGIREFRKEMKAMHKRKGKLEDHRNTQHATHARLSLRLMDIRTRTYTTSANTHK